MFTDKFKVFLGVILFLFAFSGLLFNQLTLSKQVSRVSYDVQGLMVKSLVVAPTAQPTATPTAALKFTPVVRKVIVAPTK